MIATTAPTGSPETSATGPDDDDFAHIVCQCSPDVALCGTDVSAGAWVDWDEPGQERVVGCDLDVTVGCWCDR